MSRLIAFGCSFTYGHGLPDCVDETGNGPGKEPSKVAWPSLLAQKLGRSVINLSQPAAGNTEILWKIFNFGFEPDDLCVIMWSYFTRSEFFMYTNDSNGLRIKENKNNPRFYEDEDVFLNHNCIANLLTMDHGSRYLDDLDIKSHAFIAPKRGLSKQRGIYFKENDRINISNLDLSFSIIQYLIDFGLDGRHPGVKSHRLIAETLYEKING